MSDTERRKRWRTYQEACKAHFEKWVARGCPASSPIAPRMPADLMGLTCGARTKAGTPCKNTVLYSGGRCKWHGGLSTGPKTEAGKEQARINGRKGGRPAKTKP